MEEEIPFLTKAMLFTAVWILPTLLLILFQEMPGWSDWLRRLFSSG